MRIVDQFGEWVKAHLFAQDDSGNISPLHVDNDGHLLVTLSEEGGGGVTDHGELSGLLDDDHEQYLNESRGDSRYYTETELDNGQLDNRYYIESEVDSLIASASGTTDHSELSNLDYASSNHTGFASDNHDNASHSEDYTTSEDVTFENLNSNGDVGSGSSQVSRGNHTHDNRYYTESEMDYLLSTVSGVTNHSELSGLLNDDHTQYLTSGRGDVRYLYKENTSAFLPTHDYGPATKKYVDDSVSTVSGVTDHNELNNLDYSSSGHTGFQPSGDYATNSELVTVSGTMQDQLNARPTISYEVNDSFVKVSDGDLESISSMRELSDGSIVFGEDGEELFVDITFTGEYSGIGADGMRQSFTVPESGFITGGTARLRSGSGSVDVTFSLKRGSTLLDSYTTTISNSSYSDIPFTFDNIPVNKGDVCRVIINYTGTIYWRDSEGIDVYDGGSFNWGGDAYMTINAVFSPIKLEDSGTIYTKYLRLLDTDNSNSLRFLWNEDDSEDRDLSLEINGDYTFKLHGDLNVEESMNVAGRNVSNIFTANQTISGIAQLFDHSQMGTSDSALATKKYVDDNISSYSDADAISAINGDADHGSTAQHDYFSGSHDDLSNISTDDHHTKYTDSEAISAINNDSDHGSTADHDYFAGSHGGESLDSSDDLDNLSDGWYQWLSSEPSNSPAPYMIMLQKDDGSQPIQIAIGRHSSGKIFVRRADSGTFYSWTKFSVEGHEHAHSDLTGVGTSDHHDPVTLSTDADNLLSLSDQELDLDTQSANLVFAGPSSGSDAEPTFRALENSDLPRDVAYTTAQTLYATQTIDQLSSAGNKPVLKLIQQDVSEEFVHFQGDAAASDVTQSLVDVDSVQSIANVIGYFKIYVQDDGNQITDGYYYVPFYDL